MSFSISVKGFSWEVNQASSDKVQHIMSKFNLNEILARLLVIKEIDVDLIEDFLNPTLKRIMPDPFHLLDMEKATEIIYETVIQNKKIVIFGDYDVDGATSSALLKRFFNMLKVEVDIYIPDRIGEGYGPSIEAFKTLKENGADLIITVDCGTASFEALDYGVKQGLKIIVIDHHLSGDLLPNAHAIVNPNRKDETSKYGYLAAVGVAFLTAVAIVSFFRKKDFFINRPEPSLISLLDIVAIGTVCDVVPLEDLNRAFVVQGLKVLNKRLNPGVEAIVKLLNLEGNLTTYHLGHVIGPRINAGGRVGKSFLGAHLLSSDDEEYVWQIANKLELYNSERKAIEQIVYDQALLQAKDCQKDTFIMLRSENWHPGVVGIVAGRLKEIFNKPVAVLSLVKGVWKASCRSVTGIDFGSAVVRAKENDILINGGGHKMAAGFSVEDSKLAEIKAFLEDDFKKQLALQENKNTRFFDSFISTTGVTIDLAKQVEKMGPFGSSNPEPRFLLKNITIYKKNIFGSNHITCFVRDSIITDHMVKVNAFRALDSELGKTLLENSNSPINLVGYLRVNRWRNRESVEFILEDVIPI